MRSKSFFGSLWWLVGVLLLFVAYASAAPTTSDKLLETRKVARQSEATDEEATLQVTHGPLSGEVSDTGATLWARGNVSGTLQFQVTAVTTHTLTVTPTQTITETNRLFADPVAIAETTISPTSDWTGQVRIDNLEADQPYTYRVTLTNGEGESSAPVFGRFQTAPAADTAAPLDFVFGGCLGGQGYCRTEAGWVIFDEMLQTQPDFFLLIGDGVYVDSACASEDVIPGAEGPYTDLEGFRTRYRYHLEDAPYANFLAQVPIYPTWDDHEFTDDAGAPALSRLNPQLFADGQQAFFEYWPISQADEEEPNRLYRRISYGTQADFFVLDTRSYRDPNVNWDPHPRELTPKTMLGAEQFAWLQEALTNSTATWKFIVSSVPLSYPTGFPQPEVDGRDGWANYTEKSGYETELLSLIFFIEAQDIDNVIFLTGDTHWPFAISYDPDRNGEANFYELSSSPLSAINLPPAEYNDPTLNPTVLYAEGEFGGDMFNFGQISIDEAGQLAFRIYDVRGEERYALTLDPRTAE